MSSKSETFELIIFGSLFVLGPIIVISSFIALSYYDIPYRYFIYGFWALGIPIMISTVLHSLLLEYKDIDGKEEFEIPVIITCAIVVLCIWPIIIMIMLHEQNEIGFLIRPPKYQFYINEKSNSTEAKEWLKEHCHGFAPLRPIVSENHIFIFRDKDFVSMKLCGFLRGRIN